MPFTAYLDNVHRASRCFRPGSLNAYLLAAVLTAAATAIRLALGDSLAGTQFISLFPAVILSTLIGGTAAGAFAAVMATLCAWYFLLTPAYSFAIQSMSQVSALATFAVVAAIDVVIIGVLRSALDRIHRLNQTLAMTFEANPDAILITGENGRIATVNQRTADMFGVSRESLAGLPLSHLLPERYREQHSIYHAAFLRDPHQRPMGAGLELLARRGDGTEFPVDIQIGPIEIDGQVRAIATMRDLTAQKALTDALEESRRRQAVLEEREKAANEMRVWADAFLHAAIGITITDTRTGTLRFANRAWADARGWTPEEAQGQHVLGFYPEHERPRLPRLLAESDRTGHVAFEVSQVRKDGSEFPALIDLVTMHDNDGVPLYRIASSRDITERKRIEEELRHAQKMEAIGTLTGGMAHDFNNLLSVIILNLGVVRMRLDEPHPLRPLVEDAVSAARRGAELTRGLLAFARRQALRPVRVDLNELVTSMHRLLSRVLGEEIEISLELAAGIWPVIADPSQVEASIVNLATNGRDAMPKGGKLTISTGNQHLDEAYAARNPSVTPGDYAMIAVSDQGTGMAPDVMAKIFEPFFTTKEPGKGTGLGLSMVFGFANQSGGHISAYSEPGQGTTMRLYLPRASADGTEPARPGGGADAPPPRGKNETILVVEDNPALRRLVTHQLSDLGYTTAEADNGPAALAVMKMTAVDLMFTDVVMPGGMDGFDLAAAARAMRPELKVLMTSGFSGTRSGIPQDGPLATVRLLSKPYDWEELARAVREALDT